MCHKIIPALLIALLCNNLSTFAQSKAEMKFKRQIFEWGTNQNINLKLLSGEKLAGRITEVKPTSFVIQFVDRVGQISSREISYNDLGKLSKQQDPRQGPSMRTMLLIGVFTVVSMIVVNATNNE